MDESALNESIQLLSSMSPKVCRTTKNHKKKPATLLALRKTFRRSSIYDKLQPTVKGVDALISTATESSSSANSVDLNLVIPESDDDAKKNDLSNLMDNLNIRNKYSHNQVIPSSFQNVNTDGYLSASKYKSIKDWVAKQNEHCDDESNMSLFSQISSIEGDAKREMPAANSTFMFDKKPIGFDKKFKNDRIHQLNNENSTKKVPKVEIKNAKVKNTQDVILIDDSSDDEKENIGSTCNRSPKISSAKDFSTPSKVNHDTSEYESLLDDLYGGIWRKNKDSILVLSEPRFRNKPQNQWEQPQTEIKPKKPTSAKNNLRKHAGNTKLNALESVRIRNALESPLISRLKSICDSDSEDDEPPKFNVEMKQKLDFKEYDDEKRTKNNIFRSRKSSTNSSSSVSSDEFSCAKVKVNTNLKTTKNQEVNIDFDKLAISDPLDGKIEGSISTPSKTVRNLLPKNNLVQPKRTEKASFLESLSRCVPIARADPSAMIFRSNYKTYKQQLLKRLFTLFNKNIFNNCIPDNSVFEWSDRMTGTAAYCGCKKITHRDGNVERTVRFMLSSKVLDAPDRLRDTLVHEMCHAATWLVNQVSDGHGKYWKMWASKAMRAFPELPPIKRCHDYAINTKYTYRCTGCGYSFGRHSKSVNIDKKCCGVCHGKFEVLINKINKAGERKEVPSTPNRKVSDFALFVKENYGNYKNPTRSHGEVMRILGQKYKELKEKKDKNN